MRRKRVVKAPKGQRVKRSPAARAAFRPALAADGAILFMGAAKGDFEIPRSEARSLVNLVRRLSGPELAVAVGFIERLDAAEVGA